MASETARKPERILLITNVDRGEANVFLAVSDALLRANPRVELHFATFGGLEESVASVWHHVRRTLPQANPITFHKINGLSMEEGLRQYFSAAQIPLKNGYLPESFLATPDFTNTTRAIRDTAPIFIPYSGPQLVEVFLSIVQIIDEVAADLVVVDSLMTPALTACYHSKARFTCLSPNSTKEFAAPSQPMAAGLWKYPALFSGFPYPVPWHLILLNIYFVLYTVRVYSTDNHLHEVARHLKEHASATLRTPVDLLRNRSTDLKILVSSLPELDFHAIIPPHLFPCGPILCNAPPVSETAPELESWLAKGSTIYINLGSICRVTEDQASELAMAVKLVMDSVKSRSGTNATNYQIYWKLKKCGEYGVLEADSKIQKILAKEIAADSVKVTDWIPSEPISLLKSGHIACSVHHGGANSFNECISTGIPQIVLPQWTDCYDYAQRVEMLGVGLCGSRTKKPGWSAHELSQALLEVLVGKNSDAMKQKAQELAGLVQRNGNGAANAAKIILEECHR